MKVVEEGPGNDYCTSFTASIVKVIRLDLTSTNIQPGLAWKIKLAIGNIVGVKICGQPDR